MPGQRFGLSFVHQPPEPLQSTYVRLAEDRGFESAWALETRLMRDAISPLSAWAARTDTIQLGTAMINPYTRTPTLLAQTFATLDELSGERSILGIGAANQMLIEDFHGEVFDRPLTTTKETIETFRRLMRGEAITDEGETVSFNGAQLDFTPPREAVPVYMGVTGPRMLKLAGAIADGVLLNVYISDAYQENAIALIEEGAREAGRDVPDIGTLTVFSIGADGPTAKAAAKPMLAEYVFNLPGLEQVRLDVGDAFLERDDVAEIRADVREKTEREGIRAAAEHVPDWVVDELAAAGTPKTCMTRLEHYFELGHDFVVPSFVGGNIGFGIDRIATHFELDGYGRTGPEY